MRRQPARAGPGLRVPAHPMGRGNSPRAAESREGGQAAETTEGTGGRGALEWHTLMPFPPGGPARFTVET